MDFLKRHYEKVILIALFLVFVVLMIYVLSIVESTRGDRALENVRLPMKDGDYEKVKVVREDGKFKTLEKWDNSKLVWLPSLLRNNRDQLASGAFSDLVKAPKIAFCPYCSGFDNNEDGDSDSDNKIKRLIPVSAFGDASGAKICPLSSAHAPLPAINPENQKYIKTFDDHDGDGIRNDDEIAYGLNSKNPKDALEDLDGDGFSNRYEIEYGSKPNSYMSAPPYWHRLRVVKVEQVIYPVELMAVAEVDGYITLRFNKDPKTDKSYYKIGSENRNNVQREYQVEIASRHFKIASIHPETTRDGVIIPGRAELLEVTKDGKRKDNAEKLDMTIGRPVKSQDERPVFEDIGWLDSSSPSGRHQYEPIRRGEVVKIDRQPNPPHVGRKVKPKFKYRSFVVKEVDPRKKEVVLYESTKKKDDVAEEIIVTTEGEIPKDLWVEGR